jgi:NAD(P)-dependent dehydrogenase (short-subunit alcohol dehydrogenase family)
MGDLKGRVALVTGAARRGSIGRAIAHALADAGATIVVNDFGRKEEAEELVDQLRGKKQIAVLALGDITSVETCQTIVRETLKQTHSIDILVNNAGFARWQTIEEISEADWDASLALHLKAPFFLARECGREMVKRGFGRIVNISSEQAYSGHVNLAHYTAAKAGLRTLSKTLAWAFAPSVTVNTVCPGPTATEKFKSGPEYALGIPSTIPLRRWGTPEEVAQSVLFLVGPGGDSFTGQTLDPNCGVVMD